MNAALKYQNKQPNYLSHWAANTLLILILSSPIMACSTVENAAEAQSLITVEVLAARLESSQPPFVLDVRTAEEYAAGHIPGAVNIDHRDVPAQVGSLSAFRDREIVVYCEQGVRAGRAESALVEAGFSVRQLRGDMPAWRAADLPIEVLER